MPCQRCKREWSLVSKDNGTFCCWCGQTQKPEIDWYPDYLTDVKLLPPIAKPTTTGYLGSETTTNEDDGQVI